MAAFEDFSGKLNAQGFKEELMGLCGADRSEVLCGPAFGVDTAVFDLGGEQVLALSSDPLSLIPGLGMKVSAWLSVHLLVNDLSTTGFAPQFAQFVLNLPPDLSRSQFREYWGHIHQLCHDLGIAITGGHTGQVPGQNSTIAGGGTMFLRAPKDQVLTSNMAKPGDSIVLTKSPAISSTALLAMAFPNTVRDRLGEEIQKKASENFWKLSVLPEALMASSTLKPKEELRAMHDVTEGGVIGALLEMSEAAGAGFLVEKEKVLIPEEIRQVAALFEIDPLISIGAGAMLMAVKPGKEDALIRELKSQEIPATVIGAFTEDRSRLIRNLDGMAQAIAFDGRDPYWEAFFKALKSGKT
jgi:hydrogenase maturation factor